MGRFNQHTTGQEVVEACAPAADGKTIVITGPSNNSIGAATILSIAHAKPKHVILCGRNKAKIDPVIKGFKEINTSTQVDFVLIDTSDLDSVRAAAGTIASLTATIDLLFANAGVMCVPYSKTKQGIEMQFATNHLGHFLFTNLLMPLLLTAEKAKVVITSSTACNLHEVPIDDINWSNGTTYNPWLGYGASKTANALFAVSLAEKLRAKGISSYAVQPGMPRTNLYSNLTSTGPGSLEDAQKIYAERFGGVEFDLSAEEKTNESACSTLLAAALDPALEAQSGAFLRNCEVYTDNFGYVADQKTAEKLWQLSEKLVGQMFPL